MPRYFSAAALFVVCTFAVACGAGTSAPLAPSTDPDAQSVTAGGGTGAGQTARDDQPAATEIEFKGRIETADAATRTLVVSGRTVTVPDTATIRNGSASVGFSALVADMLVEIIGTEVEAGVTARIVDILPDPQVTFVGLVSSLTGDATVFAFFVDGRRVTGTQTTEFKGGSAPSFARLADGGKVQVKGLDKGAYVAAERIVLQDLEDEDAPDAPEVEVTGAVAAITGDAPALTLTIGGTTVLTTSATTVRIRNQTVSVSDLRVGQTLEVTGTADAEGAIVAKRIQIEEVEPAPAPPAPQPFEAEGLIASVTGTCPAASFVLQGKTIVTNLSTKYVQLTCGGLTAGTNVRVKGTFSGTGPVTADWIKKDK